MTSDSGRDDIVEIKRRVFPPPGIVAEVIDCKAWRLLPYDKDRAMVAAPWFMRRIREELDAIHRGHIGEQSPDLPLLFGS